VVVRQLGFDPTLIRISENYVRVGRRDYSDVALSAGTYSAASQML
jgi:hypothetical protein